MTDSSTSSCCSHGVDMLKFTEFDSVRTVQGYICLHVTVRFYNVQNENSNEISIPPMKLEHLALVLYSPHASRFYLYWMLIYFNIHKNVLWLET